MAQGRVDFAGLATGSPVSGFSGNSWGGSNANWEVASEGAALNGKLIRKISTNGQFDLLRHATPADNSVTEVLVRARYTINAFTLYAVAYGGSTTGWGVDVLSDGTAEVSKLSGGTYAVVGSAVSFGAAPVDGDHIWLRVRWEGVTSTSGRLRAKVWREGDAEPGTWLLDENRSDWPNGTPSFLPGIHSYDTGRVGFDYWSWGTAGDSAPDPLLPPSDPSPVEVSDIRRTTAKGSASAYSHPQGAAHAVRRARVRRISTDTLVLPAASVALSGPFYLTGLPEGPEGAGGIPAIDPDLQLEVQDEDENGLTSAWGVSDPFQTENLWEAREYVTVVDLLIERPEGEGTVMQSYADFGGVNWIKPGWRVTPAAVDTPIGSATFLLHRQVMGVSLAPLVTGSALNLDGATFAPALDFGREVEFRAVNLPVDSTVTLDADADYGDETLTVLALDSDIGKGSVLHFPFARATVTAETAAGATSLPITPLTNDVADGSVAKVAREPTDDDWLAGFHWRGLTDDIDWPRKTGDISVPCRDFAGRLQDTMMRTEARYGDPDTPPDAFDVMQAYVDAHMGVGQYVLSDLTTGDRLAVTEWIPKDVKVWEGLQQMALQWGGKSIRQVDGPTESQISVIEPDREASTAEYRVGPETYLEVHRISTSGENLRTIVRGRCVDSATGEILVSQMPAEEDVDTDPLVDLYGPLFLQFDEDQASAIDTQPELDAMVLAAYADVSTPPFPVEVETRFAPFAAIGAMVEWGENELLWDEPMTAAVYAVQHSGEAPGVARTRWQCTDRPKGHWQEWRRRGVEVAGIGKRPSIFSLTLTHDPVGTLNVEVDYNDQVEFWRAWDAVGASPITAGVPDNRYAQGEYRKPVRLASWSVQNGLHYVAVRAYAGERFAKQEDSIVIVGVGPGSGEVPITYPTTPRLYEGTVDGAAENVLATWTNTNDTDALELEYFILHDDGTMTTEQFSISGGLTSDEREYAVGDRVTMHVRYTAGPGLEGPWSPLSNQIHLRGTLP